MTEDFAAALRGAAPYINAHRGRICVVHIPGEATFERDLAPLIYDLAVAHSLGLRLVLVAGTRPQIDAKLAARQLKSPMVGDLRVTDAATLECVKEAAGSLRSEIEALLSTALASTPLGGARIRVASGNLVTAKPVGIRDGVDLQYTGEVRRIDSETIREHLRAERIVVLPALGYSPTGEIFNLRSEDVALVCAQTLQADKLVCFVSAGVTRSEFDLSQARAALAQKPAGDLATTACANGVHRAHILSVDQQGAFLRELYTRDGSGILVTGIVYDQIRQAGIDDVGGLLQLIEPLEREGVLVARSREQLELEIDHFTLMLRDGGIIGCFALLRQDDEPSAELACLAMDPAYRHGGRAAHLLGHAEAKARELGLQKLFVLTTHTAHWFIEHGFVSATLEDLPGRRQSYYNYRRNSQVLVKVLH